MICLICSDFPRNLMIETIKSLPLAKKGNQISVKAGVSYMKLKSNTHFFIDWYLVRAIRSWKAPKCCLHLLLLQRVHGECKNSFSRSLELTNSESKRPGLPHANIHINQQPCTKIAHIFIPSSPNWGYCWSSPLKNWRSWRDKRYSTNFDFRCHSLLLRKHDVLCGVLLKHD